MWYQFLKKFVKFIDPKLEKYRDKTPTPKPKYTPKTLEDFIDVIRRTPKSILNTRDRDRIAAIMNFDNRTVKELMIPKSQMVFVNHKEILGPLTLDKLYKSGFTNFPVVDDRNKVKGIIHTEALNALEIKQTDRAEKYLDKNVYYLHINDSLEHVITEIEHNQSYYFLVLDDHDSLAGFFTIQMLLDYLLN